jgi:hypothetical protein
MGGQGYEPLGWTAVSMMVVNLLGVDSRFVPKLPRILICGFAVASALGVTCVRLNTPIMWYGWTEQPVSQSLYHSRQPLLKNLSLQPECVNCLDGIVDIIKNNSEPDEPILSYPFMPIFYYLTGRTPPTFTYNQYIDVCPDKYAREDAARLLKNPPVIVVEMVFPSQVVKSDEELFRAAEQSGQRELQQAIRKITANYTLVATFRGKSFQYAWEEFPIKVWVRGAQETRR